MKKKVLHAEIMTNQIVGILIGWMIVYFIFPLLPSDQGVKATISSVLFFCSSYLRSWMIRVFFHKFY